MDMTEFEIKELMSIISEGQDSEQRRKVENLITYQLQLIESQDKQIEKLKQEIDKLVNTNEDINREFSRYKYESEKEIEKLRKQREYWIDSYEQLFDFKCGLLEFLDCDKREYSKDLDVQTMNTDSEFLRGYSKCADDYYDYVANFKFRNYKSRFDKIKQYLKQIREERQHGILSSYNLIEDNLIRLCDGDDILGGTDNERI